MLVQVEAALLGDTSRRRERHRDDFANLDASEQQQVSETPLGPRE